MLEMRSKFLRGGMNKKSGMRGYSSGEVIDLIADEVAEKISIRVKGSLELAVANRCNLDCKSAVRRD
jgi:hypothetical protein